MKKLILALMLSVPAFAALPPRDPCADVLPHALNVGLPRIATATSEDLEKIRADVTSLFHGLYSRHHAGQCGGRRRVQINLAIGNDYQMLAWLHLGLIDAGIVTDVALKLLLRDRINLYEINADTPGAPALLPVSAVAPIARRRQASGWSNLPDASSAYGAFLDEVWRAATTPLAIGEEDKRHESIRSVVILASHLSSTGFAWPVNEAARIFNERLAALGPRQDATNIRSDAWRFFFHQARLAVDCTNAWECAESALGPGNVPPGAMVIVFPGEHAQPAGQTGLAQFREHFVIGSAGAQNIFGVKASNETFMPAEPRVPGVLQLMLDGGPKGDTPPPRELLSMIDVEPTVGTRTYEFSVHEALQLLRQQQRSSSEKNLALVLPGGGVKAAYQTRIVDLLYKNRYIANAGSIAPGNTTTLAVRDVIGTSGGALLGYFVSQLGPKPIELFPVLWNVDGRSLESADVFGETDLLRYVSVVVSIAILCAFLIFRRARREKQAPQEETQPGEGDPPVRRRLAVLFLLFFIAPILSRWSAGNDVEHVPEIEGIFYSLMALMVVFADHWIVTKIRPKEIDERRKKVLRNWNIALLAVGAALASVALFRGADEQKVTFAIAFGMMTLLVVGGALTRAQQLGKLHKPIATGLTIIAAIGLVMLLAGTGWIVPIPHIVAGFFLFAVGVLQVWYFQQKAKRGVQLAITILALYLIAALCWPEDPGRERWSFLSAESLRLSVGAFFLSLGLIVLMAAAVLWAYRGRSYDVADGFRLGVALFVMIIYCVTVVGTMMVLTKIVPTLVTPLELTYEFWIALIAISVAFSALVRRLPRVKRLGTTPIPSAIEYLSGTHPNGVVWQKRFGRILAVSVFAVVWWNGVCAPALYGNREAEKYQNGAIARFEFARQSGGFKPTARFVAPANLLEQDGTRYFMFLADHDVECPALPERPASGARWFIYKGRSAKGDCMNTPSKELVGHVALASGSPFPIFPAHQIKDSPDGDKPYIDGGYSNVVPVDAARTLDTKQLLIVQSSSSLPSPPEPPGAMAWVKENVASNLVVNGSRLFDFLFMRSQQVDRLSRADLFVVSLTPSRYEQDWPPLFDFRDTVITRMSQTADRDLTRRIGIVESWGRPAFALPVTLDPVRNETPAM